MTSMTLTFYNLNKSPLLQFTKHKLPDPHLLPNYYAMPFMQTYVEEMEHRKSQHLQVSAIRFPV